VTFFKPAPKSLFEVASLSMKQLLRYLTDDLRMPPDTIRLMVDGMLRGIAVEQLYAQEVQRLDSPPRPPEQGV
jgi:hypothetical protein